MPANQEQPIRTAYERRTDRLGQPLVSVIVPNWNGRDLIGACLDSLRSQNYPNIEIIVVDGASKDGSAELVAGCYPEARLLRLSANLGFSGNVNAGLRTARGEFLALLNNDAEAEPAWLAELVQALLADPGRGSCAAKILHHGQRRLIASAGDVLKRNGLAAQRGNGELDNGRFDRPEEVFAASGGGAIYRRAMLEDVGLLDERFVSYLEDVDLGLRARLRGWRCWYVPTARVYHRVSATGGGNLASFYVARNSIRLLARGFPTLVLRACWRDILGAQARRAFEALRAWRGAAARATLRGLFFGLLDLPNALVSRRAIQASRTLADHELLAALE
jgi:GT2 family glycosyltransferase